MPRLHRCRPDSAWALLRVVIASWAEVLKVQGSALKAAALQLHLSCAARHVTVEWLVRSSATGRTSTLLIRPLLALVATQPYTAEALGVPLPAHATAEAFDEWPLQLAMVKLAGSGSGSTERGLHTDASVDFSSAEEDINIFLGSRHHRWCRRTTRRAGRTTCSLPP